MRDFNVRQADAVNAALGKAADTANVAVNRRLRARVTRAIQKFLADKAPLVALREEDGDLYRAAAIRLAKKKNRGVVRRPRRAAK